MVATTAAALLRPKKIPAQGGDKLGMRIIMRGDCSLLCSEVIQRDESESSFTRQRVTGDCRVNAAVCN